jgi:uncharacterized membrane protein YtjA (UPF0391 family)
VQLASPVRSRQDATRYECILRTGTPVAVGRLQARRSPGRRARRFFKETIMLYYAALFFVIALVAALFGFGGIAAGAAEIAKVLFFIFLVLFVVSLIAGTLRRGP